MQGWSVIAVALAYIGCLFAVASYGDRLARRRTTVAGRPFIYALSLAVYCTSWTFFGSVGLAATAGLDFLPVYIGAGLMIGAGFPVVKRIIELSKAQNITSIADFIGARYGKSQTLAALVTVIAVIGVVPYIALQLKAISLSLGTMLGDMSSLGAGALQGVPLITDVALLVAIALALFAILFGTRHIDATEHQDGLMLAIAAESVVKLLAFLAVGVFVTFYMFDGVGDLFAKAAERGIEPLFTRDLNGGKWLAITFLSLVCIILLPRQFHVTVVENNKISEARKAAWLFPLYLVAINIFVVPIAIAGLIQFPDRTVDADMFVLALPLSEGATLITYAAFIGGLSAATAMVIVASVALAIMVCNDLVVPLLLRHRETSVAQREDMGSLLLNVRRMAILAVVMLAYGYYHVAGDSAALASIGLMSFVAIAQFAPAFFGGMIWRRATARGAIAGLLAGFVIWAYTLLLPSFVQAGLIDSQLLSEGPWGLALLRPQTLFSLEFDPLTHGVLWSLFFNVAAYVSVSLLRTPEPIERLQANLFVNPDFVPSSHTFRLWRSAVTVDDLKRTVARYMGAERTERSFAEYASNRGAALIGGAEADAHVIRFAEYLLASAIGAASSRLVLSLLIQRRNVNTRAALKLLDDASVALQYNRDLLQTALDHVRQGICVFDRDMQLICWNRQFRELLQLPPEFGRVGVPLPEIVRYNAERGELGEGAVEDIVSDRVRKLVVTGETYHERLGSAGIVLEVRTDAMPDGGIVTTYTDITDQIRAAEELARANENLERRVQERTEELTRLNEELDRARAEAEQANLSKTRFLAAAGHDILQPLNAARLYATGLLERYKRGRDANVARNIDASLDSVEEILSALLDISRLDTGALQPQLTSFPLDEMLQQLKVEFQPVAKAKGLRFDIVPTAAYVRSDRKLLRRVLQNLIANAIKYTRRGRVLIGVRRRHTTLRIEIHDTGPGIPVSKQKLIFKEFQRLEENTGGERGVGLGLSIVERAGKVLDHPIGLDSVPGRGSVFSVEVPQASASDAAPAPRATRAAPGKALDGLRVLCIDNDAKILDGMAALLTGWGCVVTPASGVREVARLLRRGPVPVDIVLADYHLDDGNGLDVIGHLRARAGADLAAILITADRSPELHEEARQRGVPILYKPLKPAALRALMGQRRVRPVAAE